MTTSKPISTKPQKVHFIGICGVGTSALATAFWNAGWKVTGSDKGFFPPISTTLTAAGIPYYAGWHPEKMLADGTPNFVIAGGAGTSPNNPEIIAAKEAGIPILSFAEAVGRYIVRSHSIVAAGTWGKSTSSALLAHIFESAHMNPSFFCGGLPVGSPAGTMRPADKAADKGEWSIVEGDEYKSAIWDEKPKFAYYKPTHLLLTSTNWDHADLYPTEKSYLDAFKKLVKQIPVDGQIVYCADNENTQKIVADNKIAISYGSSKDSTYRYGNVVQTKEGITFDIVYHGKTYNIQSSLLGAYNAENITGCFAMAHVAGIAPGDISDGIKSFRGMKRRLEKRYEHHVTIIDDIAHSPEKARSVLANLRSIYRGSIIAVYEPNTGNRTMHSVYSMM